MARSRPESGVRVVKGTVAHETDDRFAGSAELRSDGGAHAVTFRATGGSDVLVVAGIPGVLKYVLGDGELLNGHQPTADPLQGLV